MKQTRFSLFTTTASLTVLLAALGILAWLKTHPQSSPTPTKPQTSSPPSPPSTSPVPPPSPSSASELRGRRGIIREIAGNRITIETIDSYAIPGERVKVLVKSATSFVLITIPKTPQEGDAVTRTPMDSAALAIGDDVVVISFSNIAASTTFSSLRIEKIIRP